MIRLTWLVVGLMCLTAVRANDFEGMLEADPTDTDFDTSEHDSLIISVICDPLLMYNVNKMIYTQTSFIMSSEFGLAFSEVQNRIESFMNEVSGEIRIVSEQMAAVPWNLFTIGYLQTKLAMQFKKIADITKKSHNHQEYITASSDTLIKAFMEQVMEYYKDSLPSNEIVEVTYKQFLYVYSEGGFKYENKTFQTATLNGVKKALCDIYTTLVSADVPANPTVVLEVNDRSFLEIFYSSWMLYPDPEMPFKAMCKTEADYKFKDPKSRFTMTYIKEDKRPQVTIFTIEYSLLNGQAGYLVEADVLPEFIKFYDINADWQTFFVTDRTDITGTYKNKLDVDTPIEAKQISRGYIYLHYMYLYASIIGRLPKTNAIKMADIKKIIIDEFLTNPCWSNDVSDESFTVKKCPELLKMVPCPILSKYIVLMIEILKDTSINKEWITNFLKKQKKCFSEGFDIKYINLGGKATADMFIEVITVLVWSSTFKTINEALEMEKEPDAVEFPGMNIKDRSYFFLKVRKQILDSGPETPGAPKTPWETWVNDLKKRPGADIVVTGDNVQVKKTQLLIPNLPELTDIQLHGLWTIINGLDEFKGQMTEFYAVLVMLIKKRIDIAAKKDDKVSDSGIEGFHRYIQHTSLPITRILRPNSKHFISNLVNSIREFDLFMFYKEFYNTTELAGITSLLAKKTENFNFNSSGPAMEKQWRYRNGHLWFADVISIFNLYLVVRDDRSQDTVINDVQFLELFDDLYYVIAKIRSITTTPVLDGRKYLYMRLVECMGKKTTDETVEQAADEETTYFESNNALFGKKVKQNPQPKPTDGMPAKTCPFSQSRLRRAFFLILFWMTETENVGEEYKTLEAVLIEANTSISGMEAVYRFLVYPDNAFINTAITFCDRFQTHDPTDFEEPEPSPLKSKPLSICQALNFLNGLVEFQESESNSGDELIGKTKHSLTLFNAFTKKTTIKSMFLDAYLSMQKQKTSHHTDNLRVAFRRMKMEETAQMISVTTLARWKEITSFTNADEMANFYESIILERKVNQAKKKVVNDYLTQADIATTFVVGDTVLHGFLEFFTRYANKANFKKIAEVIVAKDQTTMFFSYKTESSSSIEKRVFKQETTKFKETIAAELADAKEDLERESAFSYSTAINYLVLNNAAYKNTNIVNVNMNSLTQPKVTQGDGANLTKKVLNRPGKKGTTNDQNII